MAKARATGSGSWLDTVCKAVCNLPSGTTMMVRRQGIEEEQANGGTSQAFQLVTPKPETIYQGKTKVQLPAAAYTIAKNKVHTFYKELRGNDGKALKFEIVVQALKVLQCVTTYEHYEYCCRASDGADYSRAQKFFQANSALGSHKGNNCDKDSDNCWPSPRPPVACSVKKTGLPFKICLTHKRSSDTAAWSSVGSPVCWYPTANPNSKPKPLGTASADWTGLTQIPQDGSSTFVSPFGCYTGGECQTSPYGYGQTWVEEFLMSY